MNTAARRVPAVARVWGPCRHRPASMILVARDIDVAQDLVLLRAADGTWWCADRWEFPAGGARRLECSFQHPIMNCFVQEQTPSRTARHRTK